MSEISTPLSELDFFKKRLGAIERLAATKQQQMNSLLEITEAVNHNMPIYALAKIYENILRAQLGIGKVALLVKENNELWKSEFVSDTAAPIAQPNEAALLFLKHLSIQSLNGSDYGQFNEFEFIIPVVHKREPIGFAFIGGIKDAGDAREEKLKFIQTITNIIVVANENKKFAKNQLDQMLMQKELKVAEEMQQMLVPGQLPNDDFIEAASYYRPHKSIGGDYYDFLQISATEIAFCISDVSGKGMAAALLMANLQANLRALVMQTIPLEELVVRLNKCIKDITKGEKYITFFIGIYNLQTRHLRYVNAGHTASILKNNGCIEELEKGCTILGMFDSLPKLVVGETTLKENAVIINFTDGLSEASDPDGELFETDRIKEYLNNNYQKPLGVFNNTLIDEMMAFKKGTDFDDDLTLLTIRFK
jgi:sigma-B regulation protein RsbU (phosphoserine phosphatase)